MIDRINVYLSGGIGNQLFQYIAGIYLSDKLNLPLYVEPRIGFLIDFKYKRKFMLNMAFTHRVNLTSLLDTFILIAFYIKRLFLRFVASKPDSFLSHFFLMESDLSLSIDKKSLSKKYKTIWLIGYWQKCEYLASIPNSFFLNFEIKAPNSQIFTRLAVDMVKAESVALGIRLYEEADDSLFHMGVDLDTQIIRLNAAISSMLETLPNAIFYIFCTKQLPIFERLNLPPNTFYVTPDNGFEDPVSTLWLLSQCRNHIFTSSSFYWWGARLSMVKKLKSPFGQRIIMLDNMNYSIKADSTWEII